MATTTNIERQSELARSGGVKVADAGERSSAFASAYRHTVAVRVLRWLLPAACLGIVALYAGSLMRASIGSSSLPAIALQRILPEDLTMHNPKYEGFDKDGGAYSFKAKSAQRDKASPDAIVLNAISGELVDAEKKKTNLTATRGIFNHATSVLDLYEAIDVVSDNGLKARMTQARIETKQSIITSDQPVEIEFTAGSITSRQMTLKHKLREAAFVGDVKAKLLPSKSDATAGSETNSVAKPFGGSNAPVDISATRLDIRDAAKVAVFNGNVVAGQSGALLTTPSLEVSYEGEPAAATTGSSSAKSGPSQEQGKLRRIIAKGPVTMTQASGETVTTDSADFDAVNETAVLNGNVVMNSGTARRATSDRADLDQKSETALLTGNVIVLQGRNEIKGRRLFIDRKGGRTQLTSPPGVGSGPGRVFARFVQGDGKKAPGVKPKTAPKDDDPTESSGLPGVSFKTDPSAPVEIEADQLDVTDAVKTAVFRGDVQAAQGDFKIRTAELQATYSGDARLADIGGAAKPAAEPTAKPEQKKEASTLTRIQAKRNVVVTSKGGQTVTGDWADYDAKAGKVVVGGNVVLSQGQTVVKGTRLVIDMTTGQSTIDTAPGQAAVQPARDGWVTEAGDLQGVRSNSGRPSAVFFPGQLREGAKKSEKKPMGANQGWSVETAPANGN